MYKAFFGLTDNPFSIAPNPHYLFLSDRHREALAHLTYGLGETGGFVLLTGEVGTGKTTVSRTLLRQLPENTDTAFILNPSLTELELLATLCDELKIDYEQSPSLKQLTDHISKFLLTNHDNGRNTVLIIDEAQHLRAEVLEQLRLLTNLETDTKKLLQVILIGQPELQQLLKRQELRQLAQRITARYHLLPLTCEEVGLYVQHRLQVAGRAEPLFNSAAIKALHHYSGGIPRLINLLCERSLMAAYARSVTPVDRKVIIDAAVEVLGVEVKRSPKKLIVAGGAAASLFVAIMGLMFVASPFNSPQQVSSNSEQLAQVNKLPKSQSEQISSVNRQTVRVLEREIANSRDIDTAYASLLQLWDKVPYIGLSACQSAKQQGLSCFQQQGNWRTLKQLNFPAVAYFIDSEQKSFYGTVMAIETSHQQQEQRILLQLNEQQLWVPLAWFNEHFSGTFEILWQPESTATVEIDRYSSLEQIQWLDSSLAKVNNLPVRDLNHFDFTLEQRLIQFQREHGLRADAIAGKETLKQLQLYLSDSGPRLSSPGRL